MNNTIRQEASVTGYPSIAGPSPVGQTIDDRPVIVQQMSLLQENLAMLDEKLSLLGSRLKGVLKPPEIGKASAAPVTSNSALAQELQDINSKVCAMSWMVNDIVGRLEV